MKPLSECRLYAFVDTGFLHGRKAEEIARDLCDGGADIVQLRAKRSTPAEVKAMGSAILPVTRKAGVPLVINDHPEIAAEIGAEFCHLGQEDFFVGGRTHVSELGIAATGLRVGLSTHAPAEAVRAIAAGAEYLGVGPVYATGTKPEAKPITLEYVSWAAKNVSIPWFAIGGINLQNLDRVLQAGARGICVVSAILNAKDVAAACREFRGRLQFAS
jgi:thiamine-phosphate pyrophosphorylase